MSKTFQRIVYGFFVLSIGFSYAPTFLGITPSNVWNKLREASVGQESHKQSVVLSEKFVSNLQVQSTSELGQIFEAHQYSLEDIRNGQGFVPKLYLAKLPKDLKRTKSTNRQMVFLQTLLPIIVEANQGILKMRSDLEILQHKMRSGTKLSKDEKAWLALMYDDYRVKERNITALLKKVDIIPISLTLAQGILESGWGTSGLAQKANSLFGHTDGSKKMKQFSTLVDTVEGYVKNLNKHPAYRSFRNKRAALRQGNKPLDAHHLAEGLKSYSERGMAYVQDIRKIMKRYKLYEFDRHLPMRFEQRAHSEDV